MRPRSWSRARPSWSGAGAMLDRLAAAWSLPPVRVTIDRTIPAHAGLGSGTQLALALGAALARLAGGPRRRAEVAPAPPARQPLGHRHRRLRAGRLHPGRRHVAPTDAPPPVIARLAFPDAWRLLLIFDLDRRRACTAPARTGPFAQLPPSTPELAGRLCRLVRDAPPARPRRRPISPPSARPSARSSARSATISPRPRTAASSARR